MKKRFLIPVPIVILDQLIKFPIRRYPIGHLFARLPAVVEITHRFNTGAAFSVLTGRPVLLALISIVLLAAITLYVRKTLKLTQAGEIAFLCLLGGGIGNLIDRVVYGGVTDYIRLLFFDFPVFNLADIVITLSISFILLMLCTGKLEENTGDQHGSDH